MRLLPERIKARLDALNLSPNRASVKAGVTRETVSRLLRGDTTAPRIDTLQRIAAALETDLDYLTGKNNSHPPTTSYDIQPADAGSSVSRADLLPVDHIPIVEIVEAGSFRAVMSTLDEPNLRHIEFTRHPRFRHARHMAFDVRGDSMDLAGVPDGSIVIAVDWADSGMPEMSGILVVVQRLRDGGHLKELTVKELEVQPDRFILHPRSSNRAHRPIVIPRDHSADNGTEISIVALVVGVSRFTFPV